MKKIEITIYKGGCSLWIGDWDYVTICEADARKIIQKFGMIETISEQGVSHFNLPENH